MTVRNYNKVFGIGLSRTGTTALSVAMTRLGVRTIHYPTAKNTLDLLANGIFRLPILEEYDAITDVQTVPFYPQLDEEYPNSKFILTVRDIDMWLESTRKSFKGTERETRLIKDIEVRAKTHAQHDWLRAAVYGTLAWDRSVFRQRYNNHHTAVMNYFEGRSNLLVLDICGGDKWEKLCPFLGFDIPKSRFPDNVTAKRIIKRQGRAAK
jgi:hypothetical protein